MRTLGRARTPVAEPPTRLVAHGRTRDCAALPGFSRPTTTRAARRPDELAVTRVGDERMSPVGGARRVPRLAEPSSTWRSSAFRCRRAYAPSTVCATPPSPHLIDAARPGRVAMWDWTTPRSRSTTARRDSVSAVTSAMLERGSGARAEQRPRLPGLCSVHAPLRRGGALRPGWPIRVGL